MFATTSRTFLSCLLVAMMVLAITSNTVEAKKCKAKKHSKLSQANLAATSGGNTSVSSSGSYTGGKFFKYGKAGLSGGQAMQWLKNDVSWMTDWTPDPFARNSYAKDTKTVEGVSMLWGLGRLGHDDDVQRFQAFQKMPCGQYKYVAYLNEFDFQGVGSSGKISMDDAVAGWEKYIAPHRKCGAKLIAPSCAMQDHETMCTEFVKRVKTKPDAVNLHVFKDTVDGVRKVVDHFRTLGYPMVITELACVNYEGGGSRFCSQGEINAWWPQVIKMLEADKDVVGYSPSDAANGPHASFTSGGGLSVTGTLLRNVLSGLK